MINKWVHFITKISTMSTDIATVLINFPRMMLSSFTTEVKHTI